MEFNFKRDWPTKFAKLLETNGYTPTTFADTANLTKSAVYNWISGRSLPDWESLGKAAKVLKMTPGTLLDLPE